MSTRHLPLPGAYNIRDLGGYATGSGQTRWRRVLRADSLHRLDGDATAALSAEGVALVIDLRGTDETTRAPNPMAMVPQVDYRIVPLFHGLDPSRFGADQTDALLAMYIEALALRAPAIATVVAAIADCDAPAVLFHCTAGKDRTGIIAALLLALAGVSRDEIAQDYAMTAPLIAPMVDDLIAGAVAGGFDIARMERLLRSDAETMHALIDHIDQLGGAETMLKQAGVTDAQIARLKARLLD